VETEMSERNEDPRNLINADYTADFARARREQAQAVHSAIAALLARMRRLFRG